MSRPPARTHRSPGRNAIRQQLDPAQEASPRRIVLTVPEVAAELQIPASTVYDLIRRGDIPSVRVGKRIRIPKRRLEDWITEGTKRLRMMPSTARRGYGEGTIRPRPDRGLWEARYRDGDGRQRSLYAPTRREVQAKLHAVRQAIVEGALIGGPHEKVGQFLERWLDAVASQRVRPRTFERYRGVVSKHLAPELGHLPLPKLAPQHIERLYVR